MCRSGAATCGSNRRMQLVHNLLNLCLNLINLGIQLVNEPDGVPQFQ